MFLYLIQSRAIAFGHGFIPSPLELQFCVCSVRHRCPVSAMSTVEMFLGLQFVTILYGSVGLRYVEVGRLWLVMGRGQNTLALMPHLQLKGCMIRATRRNVLLYVRTLVNVVGVHAMSGQLWSWYGCGHHRQAKSSLKLVVCFLDRHPVPDHCRWGAPGMPCG